MEIGHVPLSPGKLMSRGAVVGFCLGLIATGPSLVSSGFSAVQILMSVPLIVAIMLLGAGFATLALLD